ncbi:MAG: response regulator [Proteobacteria bacterium]|nr:response regulator [Pseudomonadota bacterium]
MHHSELRGNTVLVVDDRPESLSFLFDLLSSYGFKVLAASDGEEALEQVTNVHPDLILLDVIMPGIDGFETCRRLKANADTKDIPVIFMTALTSPNEKLVGFDVGGVDYVTKPINQEELMARVSAQVSMRQLHNKLKERNEELSEFSRMVAHDLRDPLTSVLGFAELLLARSQESDDEERSSLQKVVRSALRMQETIDALLLLANVSRQAIELKPIDAAKVVTKVLDELAPVVHDQGGTISQQDTWPMAMGHEPWVEQVWLNYIANGLKYGGDPPLLELGADPDDRGMVRYWIRDNGSGIPDSAQNKIFQPFVRLDTTRAEGHGLGLSIVKRIVHRLGGEVGVRVLDTGSEFFFTLQAIK